VENLPGAGILSIPRRGVLVAKALIVLQLQKKQVTVSDLRTIGATMALANAYVQVYGQLSDVFERIAEGQAPDKFTTQHLKDLGFASSNFRAVIPLLKQLGFLSPDGTPTTRYHDYRNTARSRRVMADAIREAYGDLFTIKANPTDADRPLIEGKFKSAHNASPNVAKLMASTFYSLLDLADLSATEAKEIKETKKQEKQPEPTPPTPKNIPEISPAEHKPSRPTLHYNIQIHLPATKDVEVFNAIFKSLKEHLLE
jgi:hypothetical protein